jgi:DNA-binding NtrC family response regulator
MEYSFPGNVRELRNMIENAVILSKDSKIKLDHFQLSSHSKNNSSTVVSPEKNYNLAALESHLIFEALNKTQFNKSRAAALLKISRQSLDRKITKLGIRL